MARGRPKSNTRLIVIIVVSAFFVLLVGAAVVGWLVIRTVGTAVNSVVEQPKELDQPGVLVGEGLLSKGQFARPVSEDVASHNLDLDVFGITDITRGQLDGKPGLEIGVAGAGGAVFLDDEGRLKSALPFELPADKAKIVDVEGDGICEFVSQTDPCLFDHQGRARWRYLAGAKRSSPRHPFPCSMCAGDVDGDGKLEFAVGFMGFTGVALLSSTGKELWRKLDTNVFRVQMVDVTGDGCDEIIYTNGSGILKVRDRRGKMIQQVRPRRSLPASPFESFRRFSLARWPGRDDAVRVLRAAGENIGVVNLDGSRAGELKALSTSVLSDITATPVRLDPRQPDYFAAVVSADPWERSVLHVYDPGGELVYQEVLADVCGAIAAVPLEGSKREALLVAEGDHLCKYQLAKPAP